MKKKYHNKILLELCADYSLSRGQIMVITYSSKSTVDAWFQGKRNLPPSKLELIINFTKNKTPLLDK